MFNDLIKIIKEKQKFIITTHVNPDGDGIGSEIAFFHLLKSFGKEVYIINQDPFLENYSFIDPEGNIFVYNRERDHKIFASSDVLIAIDLSNVNRLGVIEKELQKKKIYSICFDHHPPEKKFADLHVVNENAASIGEMIYELAKEMGVSMTKEMAIGIYVSILTDTGSFRYTNTRSKTHQITAELLKFGIQPYNIYRDIYESDSYQKIVLMGKMLTTLRLDNAGTLAWAVITKKMMDGMGIESFDKEGFIDILRSIKGLEVAILFFEKEEKVIKVSFRSKGNIDVNRIASIFGGGGHRLASGATIDGEGLELTIQKMLKATTHSIKVFVDSKNNA